jgi:hypothetical protein
VGRAWIVLQLEAASPFAPWCLEPTFNQRNSFFQCAYDFAHLLVFEIVDLPIGQISDPHNRFDCFVCAAFGQRTKSLMLIRFHSSIHGSFPISRKGASIAHYFGVQAQKIKRQFQIYAVYFSNKQHFFHYEKNK